MSLVQGHTTAYHLHTCTCTCTSCTCTAQASWRTCYLPGVTYTACKRHLCQQNSNAFKGHTCRHNSPAWRSDRPDSHAYVPPERHLRRHDALSLDDQRAARTATVAPSAQLLVSLQTRHDAVVPAASTFRCSQRSLTTAFHCSFAVSICSTIYITIFCRLFLAAAKRCFVIVGTVELDVDEVLLLVQAVNSIVQLALSFIHDNRFKLSVNALPKCAVSCTVFHGNGVSYLKTFWYFPLSNGLFVRHLDDAYGKDTRTPQDLRKNHWISRASEAWASRNEWFDWSIFHQTETIRIGWPSGVELHRKIC